ncbi:leucyl aminopeptidase [Alicyclobacillus ferrooxydans]|uniref:Probable cytosol aminopeptidase n=1 Tax=Alicyclobacillus ferrooxydans TaxID=471514 RepID=A0A0P9CA25_9BACL|nr:leucyl aminopeptidase [Alicyclobacillus ferrooxydans]KPV42122.1 hypothetical protein AN477_18900 [Alicyclobacillus ferrooxydans]
MQIDVQSAKDLLAISSDLVVLTCSSDTYQNEPGFTAFNHAMAHQLSALLERESWTAKQGDVFETHTLGQITAPRFALIGLGTLAKEPDLGAIRLAAATAVRRAAECKANHVAFILPEELSDSWTDVEVGQAIAEGALLANYHFESYARDKKTHHHVSKFTVYSTYDVAGLSTGIKNGEAVASGVCLARDLVNTPGNRMTPTIMAEHASKIAHEYGMTLEVLDREQMEELGMGALLAVAQGSVEPPKMIVLRYQGRDTWDNAIGLVGKGITFDSGGLSIKTAAGMENMKTDMGGGASVLGTMKAIGQLRPAINVVGVVPATENMPSGSAFRPGDVISAMTGKTIEVLNTDAEGRLALADGVAYAKHHGASQIIDLATLTGAALVALGTTTTAAVTNDEAFLADFMEATQTAGEKAWQLPAFDEYKDLIKSDIADVKNTGGRFAGTITAALFIREFVENTPWIHLDIAGTAYSDKGTALTPKGATGVMVRSLVQYLLTKSR